MLIRINMNKTISLILALSLCLMCVGCKNTDRPHASANGIITVDNGKMRENMTAMDYAEDMGMGINLGNTFDGFYQNLRRANSGASIIGGNTAKEYERCWGAVETTQEIIDGMKNEGFKTVRLPVYWGNMMEEDDTFTINEQLLDRVEEVINYCRNDGLYVVVNIHHYDEYIIKHYSRSETVEIIKRLWAQIAERYKEYSDYLIFEGFNEHVGSARPEDDFTEDEIYDYVNELNRTFVNAVRATGGNNSERVLIISGYHTNIDRTTDERFVVTEDTVKDRLMVSVHYADNACYWEKSIGSRHWVDYTNSQCELLKKAFIDKGIPVFMGEINANYDEESLSKNKIYDTSAECVEVSLGILKSYKILPVVWDTNDSLYYRTLCRIKSPDLRAVINDFTGVVHSDETDTAA